MLPASGMRRTNEENFSNARGLLERAIAQGSTFGQYRCNIGAISVTVHSLLCKASSGDTLSLWGSEAQRRPRGQSRLMQNGAYVATPQPKAARIRAAEIHTTKQPRLFRRPCVEI